MTTDRTIRPTDAQMTAYTQAFDYFNEALFGGRLPQPMLGFTSRKMVHGLFITNAWKDRETGEYVHEIRLNPRDLAGRTPRDIAGTLVHEMCHEDQELNGSPGRKGYHNHEFAQMMRALGLRCTDDGTPEGKETGTRITHIIEDDGPFARAFDAMPENFFLPFLANSGKVNAGKNKDQDDQNGDDDEAKPKKKSSKLKYSTLDGTAFWGKSGIHAVCFHTGAPFLCEDDPADQLAVMTEDPYALELFQLVAGLSPEGRRGLYHLIQAASKGEPATEAQDVEPANDDQANSEGYVM